jgi:hypothetical protein
MRSVRNRSLVFHIVVCIVIAGAAVWIDGEHIQPLSAPPNASPPGLHLAWAGRPLRGYAESVETYVTSCRKPAYVKLELYPAVGLPWKPPAAGLIAFAISGDMQLRLQNVAINLSNKLGRPLRALHGPVAFSAPHAKRNNLISASFVLHPRSWRNIEVSFEAYWLFPRIAEGSCWLDLPSLMGGNTAVNAANEVIGHSNWTEDERGAPLYSASNYLHDTQGDVRLNSSSSIPLPSELEEPSWGCVKDSEGGHNCEAFAALERPGTEASRTRQLSHWNLVDGLLLGFLIGILIELGHLVFQIGRFSPPRSASGPTPERLDQS